MTTIIALSTSPLIKLKYWSLLVVADQTMHGDEQPYQEEDSHMENRRNYADSNAYLMHSFNCSVKRVDASNRLVDVKDSNLSLSMGSQSLSKIAKIKGGSQMSLSIDSMVELPRNGQLSDTIHVQVRNFLQQASIYLRKMTYGNILKTGVTEDQLKTFLSNKKNYRKRINSMRSLLRSAKGREEIDAQQSLASVKNEGSYHETGYVLKVTYNTLQHYNQNAPAQLDQTGGYEHTRYNARADAEQLIVKSEIVIPVFADNMVEHYLNYIKEGIVRIFNSIKDENDNLAEQLTVKPVRETSSRKSQEDVDISSHIFTKADSRPMISPDPRIRDASPKDTPAEE